MPYNGKTDWKLNDTVYPEDMNRIEGQIGKNTSEIEGVSGKIGNPSDEEEQLTLFGKLAAILTKVLGIDTKVGTSDDAKTEPTLFGKIAGIGDTLSENLTPVTEKITEVLTKVTGIDGKIGTSGDSESTDTIFGILKKLLNLVNEKQYSPSDSVKATLTTDGVGSNGTGTQVVLKRKAEYSGTIRIKIGSSYSSESKPIRILIFSGSNISSGGDIAVSDMQPLLDAMKSSEGTKVRGIISSAIYCNFNTQIGGSASNLCFDLNVNKGEYYYMLCSWSAAYVGNYVKNAQLCYDII